MKVKPILRYDYVYLKFVSNFKIHMWFCLVYSQISKLIIFYKTMLKAWTIAPLFTKNIFCDICDLPNL